MFTHTGDREAIEAEVLRGNDNTVGLIGEIEQESALLASEDNDFLIRMGVSRKLLTEVMYRQNAVADGQQPLDPPLPHPGGGQPLQRRDGRPGPGRPAARRREGTGTSRTAARSLQPDCISLRPARNADMLRQAGEAAWRTIARTRSGIRIWRRPGPEQRTWAWYHYASLWIGMIVAVPGWMLAAGLVEQGMSALAGDARPCCSAMSSCSSRCC